MGGRHRKREGYTYHILKYFPNKYLILIHYMISVWWAHFLSGLGNYVIQPGLSKQVMALTTRLMDLRYDISVVISNLMRVST